MDAPKSSKDVDLSSTFGGIGPKLRAMRLERGLSQEQIAKPWFTKSYISAVERNKVRPSLKALELITRRLEIPIQELLATPLSVGATDDLVALEQNLDYQLDHASWMLSSSHAHHALQLFSVVVAKLGADIATLNTRTQFKLNYLRGRAHQQMRNPQVARQYLDEALLLAQQLEDGAEEVAQVQNVIGSTYYDQDMPRRALEHHEQALQEVRTKGVKDPNLLLEIRTKLANDYWALGDSEHAHSIYGASAELLTASSNLESLSASYHSLSTLYYDTNDLTRARRYGAQALTLLEAAHNVRVTTTVRLKLAQQAIVVSQYAEAAELLEQAMDELPGKGNVLARSAVEEAFAIFELKRSSFTEADQHARNSLQLAAQAFERGNMFDKQSQVEAARVYARALRTSALVAEAHDRNEDVDKLLQQALDVAKGKGLGETIGEIEFDLAELLVRRGLHLDAAEHYRAAYQQRRAG